MRVRRVMSDAGMGMGRSSAPLERWSGAGREGRMGVMGCSGGCVMWGYLGRWGVLPEAVLLALEERFCSLEVFGSVDADGLDVADTDFNFVSVFKPA